MTRAHVTKNGQITLPKEALRGLHLRAGDTVDVTTEPDGSIRIYPWTLTASDVAGMLKTKIRSAVKEMDEAVAEAFRKNRPY